MILVKSLSILFKYFYWDTQRKNKIEIANYLARFEDNCYIYRSTKCISYGNKRKWGKQKWDNKIKFIYFLGLWTGIKQHKTDVVVKIKEIHPTVGRKWLIMIIMN